MSALDGTGAWFQVVVWFQGDIGNTPPGMFSRRGVDFGVGRSFAPQVTLSFGRKMSPAARPCWSASEWVRHEDKGLGAALLQDVFARLLELSDRVSRCASSRRDTTGAGFTCSAPSS